MNLKVYTSVLILSFVLSSTSKVEELSVSNFDGSPHFVQVYEDNCQNCAGEEKELDDASKSLQGIIKMGKINLKNVPLLKGQKLPKNPSYFFIKGSMTDFEQYKEKVSRVSIVKFILSEIEKLVKSRDSTLFGKKTQSGSQERKQSKSSKPSSSNAQKDPKGVIVLTDANFEETVLNSDEAWFVELYSPSCGHCHALQPEYDQLPSKIGKRVKIAKIDATVNRQIAQKFQIKGFPTLLFFGLEDKSTPVPYNSERTAEAMTNWLLTQNIAEEKLEFVKLSEEAYNKECNRNVVCLIFILEKKSDLKNLDFVEDLLEDNKGRPLRFFYSGRLTNFEQTLMIEDRSTPKLVSVWDSLNSYKVFNSEMSKENVEQYITKIMERKSWIKLSEKVPRILFDTTSSEL